MSGTFTDWNPYNNFVQGGLTDGQFLSGSFTMLAAGPPRVQHIGGSQLVSALSATNVNTDTIAYPMGIVQSVNLSHTRQFNRFWEVGSERSFFISGRTVGQLGLGRVLYHGPSLLRTLYAYYADLLPPTVVPALFPNLGLSSQANPHDVKIPPGFENFFINLASDLFSQPVGILMTQKDSNEDTYGVVYLESCYVPSHTFATDAQGVIIQESAAMQFERAVPVAATVIATITGATFG